VNKTNIPFIFIALSACATARADLVVLENGDRYTGAVQTLSEDVLNFKTGFGTLALPWGQVARLETDAPVLVTLADGNKVSGILKIQGERLGFQDEALAGLSLAPSQIVALGPPDAPVVALEGRLSAGANVSQGNTEAQTYHADAEFMARKAKNRYTLGALVNYGEDNGQTIVDDADDTLLRSQTGIRSPLFGNLSGGLEVNFDYDWQPPAGTENQDVSYLLKLIYEI
jgi:hypothetical protein